LAVGHGYDTRRPVGHPVSFEPTEWLQTDAPLQAGPENSLSIDHERADRHALRVRQMTQALIPV